MPADCSRTGIHVDNSAGNESLLNQYRSYQHKYVMIEVNTTLVSTTPQRGVPTRVKLISIINQRNLAKICLKLAENPLKE